MKMKKKKFPKTFEDVSTEDLGVEDVAGVVFRFWDNPSKVVINDILAVVNAQPDDLMSMPEHKLKEMDHRYNAALCALFIDSNIEGLSFDTPEDINAAYEHPDLPIGFLHIVVVSYVTKLLRENDRVKKTVALYLAPSRSGKEEPQEDSA